MLHNNKKPTEETTIRMPRDTDTMNSKIARDRAQVYRVETRQSERERVHATRRWRGGSIQIHTLHLVMIMTMINNLRCFFFLVWVVARNRGLWIINRVEGERLTMTRSRVTFEHSCKLVDVDLMLNRVLVRSHLPWVVIIRIVDSFHVRYSNWTETCNASRILAVKIQRILSGSVRLRWGIADTRTWGRSR